jgi:hypothetical protein
MGEIKVSLEQVVLAYDDYGEEISVNGAEAGKLGEEKVANEAYRCKEGERDRGVSGK